MIYLLLLLLAILLLVRVDRSKIRFDSVGRTTGVMVL